MNDPDTNNDAANRERVSEDCGKAYKVSDREYGYFDRPYDYRNAYERVCLACWLGVGPEEFRESRGELHREATLGYGEGWRFDGGLAGAQRGLARWPDKQSTRPKRAAEKWDGRANLRDPYAIFHPRGVHHADDRIR